MYFYLQKYEFISNHKSVFFKNHKTMKLIITILLVIKFGFWCRAQVFDDFADGDFIENPAWLGDDSLFIINENKQLQLNAASGNNACLSVAYKKEEELEWRFWIKEKFSPSGNNYCDVYLISDGRDFRTSNQSYILRFGESGSEDVIRLLRNDSVDSFINLCNGSDTFIASSFSTFIKVTYDKSNHWKIYVDKDGSGFYKLEAECYDNSDMVFNDSVYFGFDCNFTSSNAKQFYFDDVYIGEKIIDSIAPELLSCRVVDDYHIELNFTESVEENTTLNTENYIIENLDIHPINVSYGENRSFVVLEFDEVIMEEVYHTLRIENITDFEGNICEEITYTFLYYEAKAYDIVINEIMADPSPPVGLPEWEYVELYNVSDYPVDLKGWKFVAGTTEYLFDENIEIKPKDYLILCHEDAVGSFLVFSLIKGFISFKVSNSGLDLALFDDKDHLISSVDFDVSWHSASYKEEGGWSLEQIDEENPCAGKHNWGSSVSGAGGTPGKCNSIKNTNVVMPDIDYVFPLSHNSIAVCYNQNMNMQTILDNENYLVKEKQIHPIEISAIPYVNDYVELVFDQEFEEEGLYTLNIGNVSNCKSLFLEDEIDAIFGIPSEVEIGDIIINEILFNPISPCVDYLEIYNRSDKVIDLSELMIGTIKESFPNPPDTILKTISNEGRILLPHSYMLISSDNDMVVSHYWTDDNLAGIDKSLCFIETKEFPSFPNTEGRVIVCNKSRKILDEVYYSEKMHYDLLIETKGVSLERISFEDESLDETNWHSASYNVNYGTPGYENSMAMNDIEEVADEEVYIFPEIFSPDGDGFDDNCAVGYRFIENGFTLNISIFNSIGVMVRSLLRNSLVSDEGFIVWDGCDDDAHRVEPGIYIVQVELFDLKGNVKRIRKVVVVATK